MIFDNNSLSALKNEVRLRLSQKRYDHTTGVEKMATYIGSVLLPDKVDELRVAALLHDIAKELSYEELIEEIVQSQVDCTEEDISVKPALHSFAAAPIVKRDFTQYATENVLSAVFNHTLGAPKMSVFDEIIFISDYAEEGRIYSVCKEVHSFIKENISSVKSYEENLINLHKASLAAINSTINSIISRGEMINGRTILTRDYLNDEIQKSTNIFEQK